LTVIVQGPLASESASKMARPGPVALVWVWSRSRVHFPFPATHWVETTEVTVTSNAAPELSVGVSQTDRYIRSPTFCTFRLSVKDVPSAGVLLVQFAT